MSQHVFPSFKLVIFPLIFFGSTVYAQDGIARLEDVYVTAEKQVKQSLGVSKLDNKDIEHKPPVNDISELVRTMPGVNLTGNTASGQHGNKRQIDIRGMGPENTLIMIDGRPVTSRNSARMSWRGERDTIGDSNWVPVAEIKSIEVIRGPAAARYGSGAAGGVVNIVTKKVSNEFHGAVNAFMNLPADKREGDSHRIGFDLSGPIVKDVLGFRLYGNLNRTDADSPYINQGLNDKNSKSLAAGQEGLINKDVAGRLAWRLSPAQTLTLDATYSRQGNRYNGDGPNNVQTDYTKSLYGKETRRIYRQSFALTHEGIWDWGDSKLVAQYDKTINSHCSEALSGGPEGLCQDLGSKEITYADSILTTKRLAGEVNVPFTLGVPHVLTLGAEYQHEKLDDPDGLRRIPLPDAVYPAAANHTPALSSWAGYVEDNISLTDKLRLVPMLRYDHNNKTGGNISPGVNMAWQLHPNWLIKGGIARAYKVPNLYQSTDSYMLYSKGNGCATSSGSGRGCYLIGNSKLKPETSINKELGFEFNKDGYLASLAYFRNDYKNKIEAGRQIIFTASTAMTTRAGGYDYFEWTNTRKALVEGLEGNLTLPFSKQWKWVNNFTYMFNSKNKETGNPLSVIPKYTINSSLAWSPTEKWDAVLTYTFYGRQEPRTIPVNPVEAGKGNSGKDTGGLSGEAVGSYGIWGISAGYAVNKNINIRAGMSNIFNKRIYASTLRGTAYTYNERGRAIWGNMKVSF
ncbi:outer membrane receptor protein [Snodgrassella communis]|uniref:TonB-dependent receptor n=1 Tax=Snodgrassella communis TaxID=2946699 RepID=A0A836MT40_9NEIS|nr:FepA family TonB-dependent siderophore receptor [Snodgrassella communis]KDN15792.1 TonB-dependent receptor [Snodgrassella communis]PIT11985.1 outer membrane receptor protein [Snodgrassella communis]PIT28968.1 outer membrane receptor protein [Snodgrassella communis]PIT29971.1 outer membrane receptor protein [Snodgrassella communis]PIT33469.1 outer membrane receptor protein [Snodgrassella communis]